MWATVLMMICKGNLYIPRLWICDRNRAALIAGIARLKYLIVYQSFCRFALGDPWVPKHKMCLLPCSPFSYSHSVVIDLSEYFECKISSQGL